MDIQTIIVTIIIFAAFVYAGRQIWRKAMSATKKSSCAVDCGCEGKAKN
jgi:hypothetical protein